MKLHSVDAGVSQREVTEHFPALVQQKEAHLETLTDFFEEHLQSKFLQADYTFDAYITSRGKVALSKLQAFIDLSERCNKWKRTAQNRMVHMNHQQCLSHESYTKVPIEISPIQVVERRLPT